MAEPLRDTLRRSRAEPLLANLARLPKFNPGRSERSFVALHLVPLLAFNVLAPIVNLLHSILDDIFRVTHNYGWSLIILAGAVKAIFWPLNTLQYKSMLKTQQVAPALKALQQKYKNDKERLNTETMALYKETGANPLASCLPLLLQLPILFSLYTAINSDRELFASQSWLWIGSEISKSSHILAANLAMPDYVLLVFYIVSMYFQVRFTSPALDPQQAQQQKIMAFVSPAMVGYMGFRFAWPSALIIYWLSFNVFTMAQQFYLMRRYPRTALATADSGGSGGSGAKALPKNGAVTQAKPAPADGISSGGAPEPSAPKTPGGGSRAARRRRSSRR